MGYFYREAPVEGAPDSGWRFLEGNEDESYMSDPANTEVCHLDTICASNPGIAPLLTSPQALLISGVRTVVFTMRNRWRADIRNE